MKRIAFIGDVCIALLDVVAYAGGLFIWYWCVWLEPDMVKDTAKELRKATCGCLCADTAPGAEGNLKEPITLRSRQGLKE